VVGQQISVPAARRVLARLVRGATAGVAMPTIDPDPDPDPDAASAGEAALRGFPAAADVAQAPDDAFAMPAARRRTLRTLATAVAEERLCLDPGADRGEAYAGLIAVPGIGPWTAQYVAMRALGDPDVLLETDLGVRRGAAAVGLPADPATLARHADQTWAPWRSYATIRLWRHA
jgi:AraC family transcriptional regulator, regulatory protein of adaptative response / DNA-3-methyladenine glycosylase II